MQMNLIIFLLIMVGRESVVWPEDHSAVELARAVKTAMGDGEEAY